MTDDAQKKIRMFLLLTLAFSSVFYALIISAGTLGAHGGIYVVGLMWSPGISALLTRLYYQRNVRGEGWRLGEVRWLVLSYLLPLAYAAVAYGAVWGLGLGGVHVGDFEFVKFLTVGLLASSLTALGEELGWRGLLVPELARITSFQRTAFISGAIWALWHMPLILFADYNSGTPKAYAVLCFAVMVIAIAFPFAWLRLRSGSVWTAMLLHASHNLWIQGFFDRVTVDTGNTRWFTTEFGAATAASAVVVAIVFSRLKLPTQHAEPAKVGTADAALTPASPVA